MCIFTLLSHLKCSFNHVKLNFEAGCESGKESICQSGLQHDNWWVLIADRVAWKGHVFFYFFFALWIRSLWVSHHSRVDDWKWQGFISVHEPQACGEEPSLKEYTSTSVFSTALMNTFTAPPTPTLYCTLGPWMNWRKSRKGPTLWKWNLSGTVTQPFRFLASVTFMFISSL